MPLRVAPVHLEQIAGPQGGLLPAGARADLEEDVLPVVGILRDQGELEPGAKRRRGGIGPLGLVLQVGRHLPIAVGRGQLSRLCRLLLRIPVGTVGLDDLAQLGEGPPEIAETIGIGRHAGRGHLGLHVLEASFDLPQAGVEVAGVLGGGHATSIPTPRPTGARATPSARTGASRRANPRPGSGRGRRDRRG